MTTPPAGSTLSVAGVYRRFALLSTLTAAALALLGYFPTTALAGASGPVGMLTGIAISLVAALAGLAPPILALNHPAPQRVSAMFQGIVVRFGVVILLTAAVVLGGRLERGPVLVWMALAYLVLMFVDSLALVRLVQRMDKAAS
ncbi:MAG: hypothetical protein AB7Q17_01735 [Phycisphaerae bacterium]